MAHKGLWILTILTTVLISGTVQGQDYRKVRFGLKVAPNYGWMKPNTREIDKDGVMGKMGFSYGPMIEFSVAESENYYFSTGFEISTNGGRLIEPEYQRVENIDFFGKRERNYRLQYINVPLLLKMRTNEIGYLTYFGAIGFDAGINIKALGDDKYTWTTTNKLQPADEDDLDIKNGSNGIVPIRAALNITLGAEYNLTGNTNLYLALGWHNGFTDVLKGRLYEQDALGNAAPDASGVGTRTGPERKAVTNYISLEVGVFF